MSPLPICILGAGSIGQRHVEVSQRSARVTLTAVVEPVKAQRDRLAAAGLPVVADIDEVPGHTRAAIIATPTQDHNGSALAAIARGWALIVEKPLAATLDEARAVIAAATCTGTPLFTGHHRRCHPFTRAARAAMARIGDPVGVQGFWSLRKHDSYFDADWRRQPGHGPMMSNLTHEIDLLHFLLGEMTEITALTSSARRGFVIEDTAAIAMRFANGALGSFLVSDAGASPWAFEAASGENPAIATSGEDYLRLTGTRGALAFPSLTTWTNTGPDEVEWSRPLDRHPGPEPAGLDPLLDQLERFAAVVGGAEDDVLCRGEDGLAAMEMTLAAALSGATGRPVRRGEVPGNYTGT